jgi:hypothetical protein
LVGSPVIPPKAVLLTISFVSFFFPMPENKLLLFENNPLICFYCYWIAYILAV